MEGLLVRGAAAALLALLLAAAPAAAAPDRAATLDAATPAFAWDGTPGASAILFSDLAVAAPCGTPGHACDDTLITIGAPGKLTVAVDGTDDPATVDIDLYLFASDPSGAAGKPITSSASGDPKETITTSVEPGQYLVRTDYAASAGGGYKGKATLAASDPATAPAPAPSAPVAPAAPAAPAARPTVAIRPIGSVIARKPKVLRGTARATAAGTRIAKVQVGLIRRTSRGCTTLGVRRRFVKAVCDGPVVLPARRTTAWSFTLPRPLPRGRYELFAIATDTAGTTSSIVRRSFSAR